MMVIMLCVVVSIMLWLFLGFHLFLIKKGYSTNEWSKRNGVLYFNERCVGFYAKWAEYKREHSEFGPNQKTCDFYGVKRDLTLE